MDENMVYLLRLFLAVVLGFAVGFERRLRSKEAAIRTHTIVAVGRVCLCWCQNTDFLTWTELNSMHLE